MTEIKLISDITVKPISVMGNDQFVIGAMKVLDGTPEPKVGDDRGRIRYLMEHRHGTPFEHNAMTFYVHAPIFVWREWHRHRIGFSYNEESARYKQLEPVFYVPPKARPMFKIATEKWKPARPKFLTYDQYDEGTAHDQDVANSKYLTLGDNLVEVYRIAYQKYEENLALNIDPGLARDCLPVGIYSACWVTCNLRSVFNFLSLRTFEPTAKFVSYPLWEIEQAARQVEKFVKAHFPLCYEAFCDFGRVAP